jgi:light-regulated signal transduction histidine kinase (bacteriophytochrome)
LRLENKKVINFESRLLLPGNKIKYINYAARGIYDSNGKPKKLIGAIADITDRKIQELELLSTLEELKRSNHELEQFAYVASHDLQEPIRMVSTYTTMLERKLKNSLDEKTQLYMSFITNGARRMHNLIQDLLAYSRVTAKKDSFVSTDLNEILAEVTREFHIAITDHKAEIISFGLPVVKADPVQIKLVFQNLIQNAIKFRSKEKPVIEISAKQTAKTWVFCIKDNGIGIPEDAYEKIFEVFQRLHEKEIYPGTGIGLSICKKVIERHGGKIWVKSEQGKGSEFCFTLPA